MQADDLILRFLRQRVHPYAVLLHYGGGQELVLLGDVLVQQVADIPHGFAYVHLVVFQIVVDLVARYKHGYFY